MICYQIIYDTIWYCTLQVYRSIENFDKYQLLTIFLYQLQGAYHRTEDRDKHEYQCQLYKISNVNNFIS